jgi:hypothetical protein
LLVVNPLIVALSHLKAHQKTVMAHLLSDKPVDTPIMAPPGDY